ncbi:MAG: cysteine desulfurase [Candidatus Spechtbacteria bacterium]|nr:cysteine desulfurase [Candidatus Spechtbacteria bacterium]
MQNKRTIYLDYAATTPMDPDVEKAMIPYFSGEFGNPSSLHSLGQHAQIAIDIAREVVARHVGAQWREIIFTGSATEADNTVIRGVVKAMRDDLPNFTPHIITSTIEHKAILQPLKELEKEGVVDVTYIPVDSYGLVSVDAVADAVKDNTVLVSIMYANNEVGTIEPIAEIGKILKGKKRQISNTSAAGGRYQIPYFHTDAVQALNYLDCNVDNLGVDFMSLSGHKIYGPKGVGALYARKDAPFTSLMSGGGQEYGRRASTENVPAIVGFAAAIKKVALVQKEEVARLAELRYYMISEMEKRFAGKIILQGSRDKRLPNNVNIRLAGIAADSPLIVFDQEGVCVSAGSACTAKAVEPSHVIHAMGISDDDAKKSLRFSFGRQTTREDIDYALVVLGRIVK